MLRLAFIVLLFSLLVAGCKKEHKQACPSETYLYQFKNNAKVDTVRIADQPSRLIAVMASGDKRVFTYRYSYNECPDIMDGGSYRSLIFEIDPVLTHFKLYAVDLQAALCYYRSGNVLYSPGDSTPEGGIIEGTKINDQKWQVDIDLKLKNNQTLTTSAIFTVE